jgi:D-glucuronyl C5-epimerase C-terminus
VRRIQVVVHRALLVVLALVAALLLAAPATASRASDARAIHRGLTVAVKSGKLTPAEAAGYRREVRRSRVALRRMSWTRAANLGAVFHDVAGHSRRLSRARSLVLFSELRTNRRWLRSHPMPAARTDIHDPDGVVYRSFPGHGLRFHPLGNFARLNALAKRRNLAGARRLADALRGRGVRQRGRITVWEYTFPFGGGRPPWTSGMAQAVAAQALSKAGVKLGDPALTAVARRAYRVVPRRLTLGLSVGPWVEHYSFSRLLVLNSQLQTAISIRGYARRAGDSSAERFAARLRTSAARLMPVFDTGYWSNYSPGNESPLRYHLYVVSLLRFLAENTGGAVWQAAAERFDRYTHEPPKLRGKPKRRLLYPWPQEGFRDATAISFWLSKISTVTLKVGGGKQRLFLRKGRHSFWWDPGRRRPGLYHPRLKAVDLAGNKTVVELDPIRIAVDREPPDVTAWLSGSRVVWRAKDRATPWIRLKLVFTRPDRRRVVQLGTRELRGSARFKRPVWRWNAKLVVRDSSGNRSTTLLGPVGGS